MIVVTRLNGAAFGINPDLVERFEETPDTVITLVDGSKFIVQESIDAIINKVVAFRANVVASATRIAPTTDVTDQDTEPHLAPAVPLHPQGGVDGSR